MKIKIISSSPREGQDKIEDLIGMEFQTVPYREFDQEIRKEMKQLGEVAIRVMDDIRYQMILNKEEYEIVG